MNNKTYIVWSNDEEPRRGFIESVGRNGIYFTIDLDNAFQFMKLEDAKSLADTLESAVVLEWK